MLELQNWIPLIYDVLTLILILSMVFSCARQGFLRTVVGLLGYAAAMVGAAACAKPLAEFIYETLLEPPLVRGIESRIEAVQPDLLPDSLLQTVEKLPVFIFEAMGLSQQEMVRALHNLIENGGAQAAQGIVQAVVAPLAVMLLRSFLFILIFGVALFFVRRLAHMFGTVNRLPVVGPANRILGGVVGLLEAALTMYVIILVLQILLTFAGGSIRVQAEGQTVVLAGAALFERTHLFKIFLNFNPLDLLLYANQTDLGEKLHQAGDLFV